jgi:uncharacterized protein
VKYLLVLLVVAVFGWLMLGRRRGRGGQPGANKRAADAAASSPAQPGQRSADGRPKLMVNCAHCGVHLPGSEALVNAQGQRFCNEAHRLAGPH